MPRRTMRAKSTWAGSILTMLVLILVYFYSNASKSTTGIGEPEPTDAQQPTKADVEEVLRGRVTFVPDGDSLNVRVGTQDVRVRLFGIDSPEGNTKQPYAAQARDHARRLADRKNVELHVVDRDRYGRVVAVAILPDGSNLNQQMVRAGLAWHDALHARSDRELAELQSRAKTQRLGLWADPEPIPPWQWRKEHGVGTRR